MSLKRILSAGFAVCLLASPTLADPSILAVPRPYNAGTFGGIQWEVFITQHDTAYTGSLSVELPLTFTQHAGPAFAESMQGIGVDDTNGTAGTTWYYNETAPASGLLLWNISDPVNALDLTQNPGENPFTLTITDGLEVEAGNQRLFASLGSTVNLPDALASMPGKQIRLLHVATTDGVLSWNNAIVGENGVQYTQSGTASSIAAGDTNGNSMMNANTGAFTDPTTTGDIPNFRQLLIPVTGISGYNAANPGLNGTKRGDTNGNGATTTADIPNFRLLLTNPLAGAGAGGEAVSGGDVPEPTSLLLLVIGSLTACVWRRRRSK